jgi:hypothetical protein
VFLGLFPTLTTTFIGEGVATEVVVARKGSPRVSVCWHGRMRLVMEKSNFEKEKKRAYIVLRLSKPWSKSDYLKELIFALRRGQFRVRL